MKLFRCFRGLESPLMPPASEQLPSASSGTARTRTGRKPEPRLGARWPTSVSTGAMSSSQTSFRREPKPRCAMTFGEEIWLAVSQIAARLADWAFEPLGTAASNLHNIGDEVGLNIRLAWYASATGRLEGSPIDRIDPGDRRRIEAGPLTQERRATVTWDRPDGTTESVVRERSRGSLTARRRGRISRPTATGFGCGRWPITSPAAASLTIP
jgi:hypothetical protein